MIDRINLILKAKNLTAKQFAEEIGIQPSGMSHILSGRNNPSLDFVMKVMRRYPEINLQWLLNAEGEMYKLETSRQVEAPIQSNVEAPTPPSQNYHNLTLFDLPLANGSARQDNDSSKTNMLENSKPCPEHNSVEHKLNSEPSSIEEHVKDILVPSVPPHAETVQEENVSQVNADEKDARLSPVRHEDRNGAKRTVRIVVFYDDNTFAEFRPE